jgi:hypothetical protein
LISGREPKPEVDGREEVGKNRHKKREKSEKNDRENKAGELESRGMSGKRIIIRKKGGEGSVGGEGCGCEWMQVEVTVDWIEGVVNNGRDGGYRSIWRNR